MKTGAMKREVENTNDKPGRAADRSISIGARARFRVLHDPSLYPLAGERRMTKFEVQFGLRYNTFTDGTVILDVVTGGRHDVVVKKVFKPTDKGGMLALLESRLEPPHLMINPKVYDEKGRYIGD